MGEIGSRPSGLSKGASSASSSRGAKPRAASSAPASPTAKSAPRSRRASAKLVDQTDWARLDALSDADIRAAIAADPDAAPAVDAAWFASATLVMPEPKRQTTLRLDADLLEWYRVPGPGWQTRMNAVLRGYMLARKK